MGSEHSTQAKNDVPNDMIVDMALRLSKDKLLSKDELNEWNKFFLSKYPRGKITLKQFIKENKRKLVNINWDFEGFFEHIFKVLDVDGNGSIDFKVSLLLSVSASALACC